MSVQDGIQRFLDDVDPVILSRGQDYYRRGHVESIDHDEGHVTAEVSGSEDEPYLVDIDFDEDGEVEAWDCDCPYDWGPVCKHTVAVLLALQAEPPEERSQEAAAAKTSVRELVERAEKEQLATLILEHCKEDKRFQSRVLSALEDSGEQELASIKALVRESIRSHSDYGYIDEDGCATICADLDDALDKARRRAGRGQYERALDIAEFVLITAMGLLESDNGCLSWTIDAALETVGLAAKAFAESGAPREEWVRRILKTAQDPVFDDWEEWRLDFLEKTAVLADAQIEHRLFGKGTLKKKKVSNHAGLRRLALKTVPKGYDRKSPHTRQKHIVFEGERKLRCVLPFFGPILQRREFSMGVNQYERTGFGTCQPKRRCNEKHQLCQSGRRSGPGRKKGVGR